MIKKINLSSKNLILNITEPDWRRMFEVYLNLDMMKHFVKDEEIEANRKAIQKKLTPARPTPKKYHLVHEKPPLCQFYYFIRGLYFECGIPPLRPDPIKAYEIFLQGFEENQDSLCAYKIAATQSNPKNRCKVKVDKQKALFFLVMSATLIDVQYQGNLLDIHKQMESVILVYEEGHKLSDILIQRYGGAYFSNEMKRVYTLMFDYQYCQLQLHQQEKYDMLLMALENQIKTFGDQFCLIYLYYLLIQKNSINNRNLKLIIDICINAKKEGFRSALNLLFKEFELLSKAQRDHFFFQNGRQVFYEMYNFLKFFGGPDKADLLGLVFQVNEFLFQKKFFILSSSLHYSLTMRIRSEIYEKGLGGIPVNLSLALESINNELSMPKENENNYAYANYVAAKLKRKLNYQYTEQQVNEHFQKSFDQFNSRLKNLQDQASNKIVYIYYLARISKLWSKNLLDTQNKYREALNLYLSQRSVYKNVKTLQFEILCIKIEKKTNSQGMASLYYGHGIQSPHNQQQLQNNVSQSQVQNYNNPQNLAQSNMNAFIQNPVQQMNQSQLNQLSGSRMNGQDQMQQSNLNGTQNNQNGFYQQNNQQNSSQLGNQQNSQNLYQSQLNNNNNQNQSNIFNQNNINKSNNQGNLNNNQNNYQSNINNNPNNTHASFSNQNNNMNGSVINSNPNNHNSQINPNNTNIFMNNQPANTQSAINNRNYQAQQSSQMSHSNANPASQQQQILQQSPSQQAQFQPQNSGGINNMNSSNIMKGSNGMPYDNQQNNQQNSNMIAQQLIGNSSNLNTQERQNYFEGQQGTQQYNTNRSQNMNQQQQYSPNLSNSNIRQNQNYNQQSNYNHNNNENAGFAQQQLQTQLQTNPNNIDYVGLNNTENIKTFQSQKNDNLHNTNMNVRNQTAPLPIQTNSGNIFGQSQMKSVNGGFDQQSPIKQNQPNQSIFGNNIQSKYLSFGFQNFNISRSIQEKIAQLMIKRTFFDPKDVIILDFLHRGNNYTTSEAVILNRNPIPQSQSLNSMKSMDLNMISADKLSKFRSYKKHMNISPEDQLILDGEPVVVKQFLVSSPHEIDEMFYFIESQEKKLMNQSTLINNQSTNVNSITYQQHLAQVFLGQSLIYIKGFSYQPVSNDAISLYLFYPAQSYNLYGAMRKNLFSLLDKLLVASYICDSLQNLHSSSIFHLNLKPSNILFDSKKHPYLSGWEIRKKEKIQQAEENIDDDEQDDKYQISYGYTPPEVINSINTIKPYVPMSNSFSTPQKGKLANYTQATNTSFNPITTTQALSQFGPSSDVWSLGMIFHYLFFRIDSGEGNFCRDKRVYGGFNLIITEYAIGSNYFLDKIKELVEDMVKSNPDQRATLSHVKDLLQKLYIELDTQMKQDYSPSRSYYSSNKTLNTGFQSNYNSVNNHHYNQNNQSSTHYSYNNINNNGMYNTPQMHLGKQISGINRSNYSPNRYDMNNNDPFYSNSSYNQLKSNIDPLILNNNNNYDNGFNYNSTSPIRNHPSQPFFNQKNFNSTYQH